MNDMDGLIQTVRRSHERVGAPARVLLGLSGGADSVALASILCGMRAQGDMTLVCIHVHHGLRRAADDDDAFVRAFCRDLGVELIVKRVIVSSQGSLEAAAREARYRAFYQAMAELDMHVLALAHHLDDQAETLMLRLMHGAGGKGLSGMREFDRGIWRPFLSVRGQEIRSSLKNAGLFWREDESNEDNSIRRNALRRDVMPRLESIAPGCMMGISRSAEIFAQEEDYWQGFVGDWLSRHASLTPPCVFLMADDCLRLHPAARRRVLRGLCDALNLSPEYAHIQRLMTLLEGPANRMDNLPREAQALRTRSRLHIIPSEKPAFHPGCVVALPQEAQIQPKDALQQAFDADRLDGAVLRYRKPGDRIAPLGAGGSKPLSEYFVDCRVDRPFRDYWPILARGHEVLWVVGVGMAGTAALTKETRQARMMRFEGRLPSCLDNERR